MADKKFQLILLHTDFDCWAELEVGADIIADFDLDDFEEGILLEDTKVLHEDDRSDLYLDAKEELWGNVQEAISIAQNPPPPGMETCYFSWLSNTHGAIADLTDYYNEGMLITRINVPQKHRGKGHGSKLLKKILIDADKYGVVLWLEILESGGLSKLQLIKWYERYGFKEYKGAGFWRREPSVSSQEGK